MIIRPIYMDTFYEKNVESATFSIYLNGSVIFSGKAISKPDSGKIKINVGSICRNYLNCDITDDLRDLILDTMLQTDHTNACRTFTLYVDGSVAETYRFIYCWDYVTEINGDETLSNPVNGHWCAGMFRPLTTYDEDADTPVRTRWVTFQNSDDKYQYKTCGDGALYYLNAKGGWDAFLIEGKITRTDEFTNYTSQNFVDNTTIEFGIRTIANTVAPSWSIGTGYLSDADSKKLAANLYGSPRVYLHIFDDDELYPVYITDTKVEYKKRTKGGIMSTYTINIKASQERQRL